MVLLVSSTAPAVKLVVLELPIALAPLIRFGIAGLVLLPLAGWGPGSAAAWRRLLSGPDAPRLWAAAACCVPINQWFLLTGTRLAPVSHVGLLYAACPLVVVAVALVLGQERFDRNRVTGILLTILGLGLISSTGWQGGRSEEAESIWQGDLRIIGAVLSWGLYMALMRPLAVRHGATRSVCATFLLGGLMQVPITGFGWSEAMPMLNDAGPQAWLAMGFLTLVVTPVGLWLQGYAMRHYEASYVAAAGNMAPILTVLWAILFFGDALSLRLVLGGAMTLLGVGLAARRKRRGPHR